MGQEIKMSKGKENWAVWSDVISTRKRKLCILASECDFSLLDPVKFTKHYTTPYFPFRKNATFV